MDIDNAQMRPLRNLLFVQFFGAFNDNAWKLIVTLLGIRAVEQLFAAEDPMREQASQFEATLEILQDNQILTTQKCQS